ncbi:hypothetical protein AK830_g7997 [Neonectria ditissima]|uniref:MARVEL domain-containing protein n=1 Tax=Neonectria ditissima TaxID=78410 RepID=A0A0P7AVL9_9HYPO|nr:hypothetical protein AK830_g7997 [Neonectria ditissima]
MGGQAGLKCMQWLLRGVQLCSAALVLAVYTYFLATLAAHGFDVSTQIRAVEGISGSGVLYGLIGVLLICCIGGLPIASLIAIVLDTGFLACFIYVAVANKHGAGNCKGEVITPYGRGLAKSRVKGKRGSLALPTYRVACQLQTACLAASIIVIIFFLISILLDIALARNHYSKNRDGNKGYGYGERSGLPDRMSEQGPWEMVPDNLPTHPHPDDMTRTRSNSVSSLESGNDNRLLDEYEYRSRIIDPPYPV